MNDFAEAIQPFEGRLERLRDLGDLVIQYQEHLARRITDSSRLPISFTTFDVATLGTIVSNYGDLLRRLHEGSLTDRFWAGRRVDISQRVGRGNVAALLPYNGPAMCFGLAFAPSYVLGQNIVIKFASESENFSQTLEGLLAENDFSDLLVNDDGTRVVSREPGKSFLQRHLDPTSRTRVLQIYGHDSYLTDDVLWKIMRKQGRFRLIMEGPGKNRFIVAAPVDDLDYVAETIARLGTINGGQTCMGAEIFDIHESAAPALIPLIVQEAAKLQVGDPYDPQTWVGPMREKMAANTYRQLEDALAKGAKVEFVTERAGKQPLFTVEGGRIHFLKPQYAAGDSFTYVPVVVLSGVTDEMLLRTQETFGPVIGIRTFGEDRELIPGIVSARYGLGASLFGRDLEGQHGDLRQAVLENTGGVFENVYMFDSERGFHPLFSAWGGEKNSRFSLEPGREDGRPMLKRLQTGPSYSFYDFSRPREES